MNVEELIVRLRIEEDNMRSEKRVLSQSKIKANVVEHGQSSNLKKKKKKDKLPINTYECRVVWPK